MICYELRKVLTKRSSQIVLLLLALLTAFSCRIAIHSVEWIDGEGNLETGSQAADKLRAAQKEWSGTLDVELLEKALTEIRRVEATPEYRAKDFDQNRIAQGWLQGVREIRRLLCLSFGEGFQSFDERVAGQVAAEELERFYDNRIRILKDWLYDPGTAASYWYSEAEKEFLLERYSELETPFSIDYAQGWIQAAGSVGVVIKYGMILLGFLLAGIFSDEFQWKAEPVYYSSRHGRGKGTRAKLAAGLLLTTLVYVLCVSAYSLAVLGSLGTDGANCPVQSAIGDWKSMYNLTFSEKYFRILGLGYIGYLFFGMLVMWISAKAKSPVLAVMIPSLAVLLPTFLMNVAPGDTLSKLLALLPDRLLDGNRALAYLDVFSVGETVTTPIPILITVYLVFAVILTGACYGEYRYKPIG